MSDKSKLPNNTMLPNNEVDHGPLGERSEYPQRYDPSVLHPIPRESGRTAIGITGALPFDGVDIWNAYEVSWLDKAGKPVVAMLELRVPCDSAFIVESKSLKLYLGSFNNSRFDSANDVQSRIEADLCQLTQGNVTTTLDSLSAAIASRFALKAVPGVCIDDLELVEPLFEVSPDLLRAEEGHVVEETLHSHLLRSNCPVTGQPDWATVIIHYRGRPISRQGLLGYLVSYRNHNDFHEQCVERIFHDIKRQCQPQGLTVYARYTRRGGIDINPFRSDFERAAGNLRLVRQ